jgi:hypothetical protein
MLHIHGGSIVLENLKAAGLPGEFLEWCDVLCEGPTPAGLDGDAWRATRAAWLEGLVTNGAYDGRPPLERLEAQDRALERATEHDEVVLWFGPDWFCQAIMIHLLPRLAGRVGKLSLVSIGKHPGVDDRRGCTLCYLTGEQLEPIFEHRPVATDAQVGLASRAWAALCEPTPEALVGLIHEDTGALPFLGAGIKRHLQEFPSPHVGLGLSEFRTLEVLGGRTLAFVELFPRVAEREERIWMTDLMMWRLVRDLATGPAPLLAVEPAAKYMESPIRLTQYGRDVLAGRADAIGIRGIDKWIGGVHLNATAVWRWDDRAKRLIREP